jgi:hypothetical protein
VVGSLIYSLVRVLLDLMATSHGDQAELQAEVLVLRRQVQVSRAPEHAGALESKRSDGSGGAARTDPAIGVGGFTGQAADRTWVASRIGASKVGNLSGSTTACPDPGGGGLLQRRHNLSSSGSTSLYMCIWRRAESRRRAALLSRPEPG